MDAWRWPRSSVETEELGDFPPLEIDEKTYGSHGISMEKRMEIRWNFDRKSMEP